MKVGTVSVDGTKVKANVSKIKSVRYDRIHVLREKLAQDIAALMEPDSAIVRKSARHEYTQAYNAKRLAKMMAA